MKLVTLFGTLNGVTSRAEKFSVSVPSDLAQFAEHYQRAHKLHSRSEVIARALQRLQEDELALEYRAAGEEWVRSEDASLWDRALGDGLER